MTVTGNDQPPPRLELRGVLVADQAPLDLVVEEGEVVAVSGEQSSELLWAVAAAGPLLSGEVLVDGRLVQDHEQGLAAGLALVTQGHALATLLTALENIVLPLAEQGREESPAAAARQALSAVGLAESADHLIEDLSGGQQQRVAVARALALRPRLLLADQATTDLDGGNRSRIVGLLRELADSGGAVLLASDDPVVVAEADRTVILRPGPDNPVARLDRG